VADTTTTSGRRAAPAGSGEPGVPRRWMIITVLAAVLSLDSADRSTLSAAQFQIQDQLHVDAVGFGLLATITSLVGLVATFPVGMLVDRLHRTRLLGIAVGVWGVAEAAGALAPSFVLLLVSRFFLGAVLAAIPAVVSLTGDYFPVAERARMFGYVLAGELLGTAFGFLGSGQLAIVTSWRWAFAVLAVAGLALAVLVSRLHEPARGTRRAEDAEFAGSERRPAGDDLEQQVRDHHVDAPDEIVPDRDPADMSVRQVVRYVLKVRSNLVLIIASALTYLFLAGVQTFAFAFAGEHLHLGQAGSTMVLVGLGAGAVLGVLVSGRVADHLIARGHLNARPVVGATALAVATVCFVPGVLVTDIGVAVPLLIVGAAALGGANPPLDSARLDVIHHHAWGRTEGIRGTVRLSGYALAPVVVGALSVPLGIAPAFALLTGALAVAALVMTVAVRFYPADVSAAIAATDHDEEAPR
jgi:MFS family permease